jgi:integrase
MRKNRSKYASAKYQNLYRYPKSPCWVFRKYSRERRREFVFSTGEEKNEAAAYRIGLAAFEKWIGASFPAGREPIFRDLAKVVLANKQGTKPATFRSAQNQIGNHLIPAFGHFRLDQVTQLQWQSWVAAERARRPMKKFYNARKHLLEILRRAYEEGFIKRVPKLSNPDPKTSGGKYLTDLQVEAILSSASPDTRMLATIVWRMGARPGEAIQWEWGMIRWDEGKHGSIEIPGRITKTGRARTIPLNPEVAELLRRRQVGSESRFIFPSPREDRPAREYKTGWRTACRKAGVVANLYWLRHTFITTCAKRGVSIVFTARYCDTSVAMIDQIYAKAIPEAMNQVAGHDS